MLTVSWTATAWSQVGPLRSADIWCLWSRVPVVSSIHTLDDQTQLWRDTKMASQERDNREQTSRSHGVSIYDDAIDQMCNLAVSHTAAAAAACQHREGSAFDDSWTLSVAAHPSALPVVCLQSWLHLWWSKNRCLESIARCCYTKTRTHTFVQPRNV